MRAAFAMLLIGCGGVAGGGDAGGDATDARSDAVGTKDSGGDAQWTDCQSPDGYQVCHGTHDCSWSAGGCVCYSDIAHPMMTGVSVCENQTWSDLAARDCWEACRDGQVCVRADAAEKLWWCAGPNLGKLFDLNGGRDRVVYADWGSYDGTELPLPPTCPSLGLPLCGGACPPCATKQVCTGRSPLHPYSICIPENAQLPGLAEFCTKAKPVCPNGMSCFVFKVQSSTQALADEGGYCMPSAQCQAAASSLPGGGFCY